MPMASALRTRSSTVKANFSVPRVNEMKGTIELMSR